MSLRCLSQRSSSRRLRRCHRCSSLNRGCRCLLAHRLTILHRPPYVKVHHPRRYSMYRARQHRLCPSGSRQHHLCPHRVSSRRRRSHLLKQHLMGRATRHHRHRPPDHRHRRGGPALVNELQCRTSGGTAFVSGQCTWQHGTDPRRAHAANRRCKPPSNTGLPP